jgi:hypothetical protein
MPQDVPGAISRLPRIMMLSCNREVGVLWPEVGPVVQDMKPLSQRVQQSKG